MAKLKTMFVCQNCGAKHSKWSGRCDSCGQWNTLVEEVIETDSKTAIAKSQQTAVSLKPVKLASKTSKASKELLDAL